MRLLWLPAIVLLVIGSGCSRNYETSAPREWSFQLQKVWEIQKFGEDPLLRPAEPRVADDGTLYFHDFERHLSYSVDPDGNPIAAFAGRGTGEGEIQFYINCFPAGNYAAICAPDKILFFDKNGKFIKAIPNNLFVRFPMAFKNENEFWVAPGALGDSPGDSAEVTYVDLADGEEKTAHVFARTDIESKPTGGALVLGLTPQIKMGYDSLNDRIFFGKNSDTTIYSLTSGGGRADSFSFTMTRYPVSAEEKKGHFAGLDIPDEVVASIAAGLPDTMTCYTQIRVINGLIYLLGARTISDNLPGLDVNVYSPKGRHLFFGRIQVEDGWHISNPDNLQLAGKSVYAVEANETGERKIVKYYLSLPGN